MSTNKKARVKQAHVAPVKFGSGDYYGQGLRNKIGRMRETYDSDADSISRAMKTKPPKTLA